MSEPVRVIAVVNWRRQRVHDFTTSDEQAQQWVRDLVERYDGDSLAATMTVGLVDSDAYERGRAAARAELLGLVDDLYDPEPCWFDHHGHCQEHGWTRTDITCPDARAQELLAEHRAARKP